MNNENVRIDEVLVSIASDQNRVALRYVTALLDSASESKAVSKIAKDLTDLGAMLKSSDDFQSLIESPVISREDKMAAVAAIAKKAKLDKLTANFLMLLGKNNRLSALPTMVALGLKEIDAREGRLTAQIDTAHVLSDKQTKELKDSLKKGLGKDITLNITQDENLLGGIVIRAGSLMIDDSVKTKIGRLQRQLRTQTINTAKEEEVA
ncbi:MAG: ATP synthase F1 subunit delta [Micavibrio sp.]|nr:ATP synthase F1 subunit delta [Micavibrio sp.]HCK32003.1 ATP synthase F1 subunit delta [Rhodospirillaceae bacterium]